MGEDRGQMGATNERIEEKVPKADLLITPSHPRPNDVVYAQAQPQKFRSTQNQLYYNWYIYNPDVKVGSVVIKNGEKVFVPSNTLEGALIRGAIAQARGSYVPGSSAKASDLGKSNESNEQDRDGYAANYGGDKGEGAIEKKIKDILGEDYDFNYKDFNASCVQNCKAEYNNKKSESDWKYEKCAQPTCGDWTDNCCKSEQSNFESCISAMWDELEKNCFDKVCDKKDKDRKEDCYRTLSLDDYSSCNNDFYEDETSCTDDRNVNCLTKGSCGAKPSQDCAECEKDHHKELWDALTQKDYCDKKCQVKENSDLGGKSIEPVGSRCFRYNFGGSDSGNHMAGVFQPITCAHFFPGSKDPDSVLDWEKIVPFTSGDGSFKEDEETYWGTDPTNADTDNDGYADEADIVGLGQQTVQFRYQSGDKLGVVAEGSSLFPTNEKTPYYKIMWAYTGTCNSEVINNAEKDSPGFNNLCSCSDQKDGKCKDSKDYGFGYLKLHEIWQNVSSDASSRLQVLINFSPQRPRVQENLFLESIVYDNDIDKDLLVYEWTLKHGGEVLAAENDPKNSRIIWKKQGVEAGYTELFNQSADFKKQGGVGWGKLNFKPILEGDYTALVKVTQTQDTKQKVGESALNFNVNENLKLRFYQALLNNDTIEKKDEIVSNEVIPGDKIIAEYDGPYYDDLVWYLDKKKLEGSGPRASLLVQKNPNSTYLFKLVASNRSRTNIAENQISLKVISPYVSIRLRGESTDPENDAPQNKLKNGFSYQVPFNNDMEFIAMRNPVASSFSTRNDLHYFWSFDEGEDKEGSENFQLSLDSKKYLPKTPHTLGVKIFTPEKKLLAQDKVTLIPVIDNSSEVISQSGKGVFGLAFAFLNLSENSRFVVQSFIWVLIIYVLLYGIAWLAPIRKTPKRTHEHL